MKRETYTTNLSQIGVIGIGGAGIRALDRLVSSNLYSAEFCAIDTDHRIKDHDATYNIYVLGDEAINGTDGRPVTAEHIGRRELNLIREILQRYHVVFLTAGVGGGTGSGLLPILAREAKRLGVLTVVIVTTPFAKEGNHVNYIARQAIQKVKDNADTLVVMPNDRLHQLAGIGSSRVSAFSIGDKILHRGIRVLEEIMFQAGIINIDFADIQAVMMNQGATLMTVGMGQGHERAHKAAEQAASCATLDMTIHGATNLLVNITGGHDLNLLEVDQAVAHLQKLAHPNARIIFGTAIDPALEGIMRVTVIASGFRSYQSMTGTTDGSQWYLRRSLNHHTQHATHVYLP